MRAKLRVKVFNHLPQHQVMRLFIKLNFIALTLFYFYPAEIPTYKIQNWLNHVKMLRPKGNARYFLGIK